MSYFGNIWHGLRTTWRGLGLTWRHLWQARHTRGPLNVEHPQYFDLPTGHVTVQYPHEAITIPDHGRYNLHCEIDDCIVCDKCAKVCPVDCIDIEAIKSPEVISYASDGSPIRLHAAKFNIDLAKCCFCGLCTTVCPTECLTMNNEYNFSTYDVDLLDTAFAKLTPEQADEKRRLYEQFVAEKEAAKQAISVPAPTAEKPAAAKPAFRPTMKPPAAPPAEPQAEEKPTSKPAFRPTMKPPAAPPAEPQAEDKPTPKPAFRPTMKPPAAPAELQAEEKPAAKPTFRPTMKPKPTDSQDPA